MSAADFDTQLRKSDPDRRMAALFASPDIRQRLFALYAFNHEIARISEASSESLIGQMKLTWWRDAIEDLYASPAIIRRHDVTETLAAMTDILPKADLLQLIEARFADVSARPYASMDEVLTYLDDTSVVIMRLGLKLADVELEEGWVRQAGRAWGLTGLMRAFPHRAHIGRAPIGLDALDAAGLTPAMLAQGLGESALAQAVEPVRKIARKAVDDFKSFGPLPQQAMPVMGYAVLSKMYLKQLADNPYQITPEPGLLSRQARLGWCSLTGR